MSEYYLSTAEAAKLLGVSDQTIRNWVSWGIIDAIYVKRNPESERTRIMVARESIDEALRSGKIV